LQSKLRPYGLDRKAARPSFAPKLWKKNLNFFEMPGFKILRKDEGNQINPKTT